MYRPYTRVHQKTIRMRELFNPLLHFSFFKNFFLMNTAPIDGMHTVDEMCEINVNLFNLYLSKRKEIKEL